MRGLAGGMEGTDIDVVGSCRTCGLLVALRHSISLTPRHVSYSTDRSHPQRELIRWLL